MADPHYADIPSLSSAEAVRRLSAEGPNELPSERKRSVFAIALEVLKEPMFLLLIAATSVYFLLGDIQEASMLGGSMFIIVGITFFQERKTERAPPAPPKPPPPPPPSPPPPPPPPTPPARPGKDPPPSMNPWIRLSIHPP